MQRGMSARHSETYRSPVAACREQPLLPWPARYTDVHASPACCSGWAPGLLIEESGGPPDARVIGLVSMATRRPRKSLVVLACDGAEENSARLIATALAEIGVETTYLGREQTAERIARAAADERADAVELCLSQDAGVQLLRELLRELIRIGRRDVSIVVHRIEPRHGRRRREVARDGS
jgi:methylmalonyl-CoA mutase cobalamin-binding domain/chain